MKVVEINGIITTPENAGWLAMMQPDDAYCVSSNIVRAIRECSEDLIISINTPGGDVDGLDAIVAALTDWTIEHGKCSLELRVQALAASCGAALLVFAPRVNTKVTAYKTSRMMFHGAMTSLDWAGADNCKDAAAMLESFNNTLKNALLARTNVPPALINSWFAASREGWLNAEDALKYGVIDEIIEAPEAKNAATIPHIANITLKKLGFKDMAKFNKTKNEAEEPKPTEEPEKSAEETPAPVEPEKSAEEPEEPAADNDEEQPNELADLRNQIQELKNQIAQLSTALNTANAVNNKLTSGLHGSASKQATAPTDFYTALANMRKEHPGMAYDDAYCLTAAQHPALYKALLNK